MTETTCFPPRRLGRALLATGLALVMLTGPAGCSFFVDPRQDVTLEASDPAARIFVDGREVGTGKAVVALKRNDSYSVRAEMADGRVAGGRIRRGVSTIGIVDIVGGVIFLFPFLGALAPGFWNLDPDYLFLRLPAPGETQPAAVTPGN